MVRFAALLALLCGGLRAETVLVIPFFNHSDSQSLDWIGESIAETVHDALASGDVLVLDREDRLEGYRRMSLRPGAELTHASIIKLADALDAARVVYGYYEVRQGLGANSKPSLSVTARVLDMKRGAQSAPYGETGALEDLAVISVRLGWQTLRSIHPEGVEPEDEFQKARPPVRIDAVESYVRGLLATSAEQRHRFFTQAARLDEHYSQPCFQLGKTYWEMEDYRVAAGWLRRVTRSDPHYLEARFYLGLCLYHGGDYEGAESAFREVADAMPLNEVFNNLAVAQLQRGRLSDAIANYRKALEGDTADPDYQFNLGYAQWRSGDFAGATASFRAALERNPGDPEATSMLGYALKGQGPRPADPKTEGRQRIKTNYDESAYRQLQAELAK